MDVFNKLSKECSKYGLSEKRILKHDDGTSFKAIHSWFYRPVYLERKHWDLWRKVYIKVQYYYAISVFFNMLIFSSYSKCFFLVIPNLSLDLIDSSDDEKLLVGNDDDVFHQTLDLVSTLTAEGVSINDFTNSTSCSDKLQYMYIKNTMDKKSSWGWGQPC